MRQEQTQRQEDLETQDSATVADLGRETVRRDAVDRAHRWLARFAPLLDGTDTLSARECHARLEQVRTQRAESAPIVADLKARAEAEDATLLTTLQTAAAQIDGVETDIKRRIGALAPGDPEGIVDLTALREDLAKLAARRELGESFATAAPLRLEMKLHPPNWGQAGGMGIFALGMLSFITFHMSAMVWGMSKAFGWAALALLPFYGIFYAAGFGLASEAIRAASNESLEVEGDTLTLRRSLGPWERERRYTLGPRSRAYLTTWNVTHTSSTTAAGRRVGRNRFQKEIALLDRDGNEVRLCRGGSPELLHQRVEQLNEYLAARR